MRPALPMPSLARVSLRSGAALFALLAACGRDQATPDKTPPATAAATTPAPATARAAPAITAAVTASASAAPSAAPSIVRSSRPTPREWCEAPVARLGYEGHEDGDYVSACKMIEVREWAMIWCPQNGRRVGNKHLGIYDRALPGGGSMATEEEVAAGARGEPNDAVVVSLRPGTRAKPSFTYRPIGHPEWLKDDSFSLELPEGAQGLSDRTFNGGKWPEFEKRDNSRCEEMAAAEKAAIAAKKADKEKAQAADDAKVLDDVAGLAAAPAEEAWLAQKEVGVPGSGALGCKTKNIESWFWMRCEGKVKFSEVKIERGNRATQTKASLEDGVARLLVPYVEGTDLRVKLTYEGGERFLKLRWPTAKKPFQVAVIVEER